MGKYMRKAKPAAEVAVMEVSQPSLGVRTRAKTLALQRLQKSGAAAAAESVPASSGSYLQLRSRRLEKPPIHHETRRSKHGQTRKEGCMRNPSPKSSPTPNPKDSAPEEEATEKVGIIAEKEKIREKDGSDLGLEPSLGENVLEFEARERSTRESTPCSLIREPDAIRTPGSTTRPTRSNPRIENPTRRIVPTAQEMDEFFSGVEEEQQRMFIEKYNFDPVNDKPLPGRFEWEKVDRP